MRDKQHGFAGRLPDAQQQLLHEHPGLVVECAKGLVEQQDLRVVGQCAGNRRALLHAAGQLLGKMVFKAAQADFGDEVVAALFLRGLAHAALTQAETDILGNGQPRKQRVALKHHAAISARALD